jgi:hypothetical protein
MNVRFAVMKVCFRNPRVRSLSFSVWLFNLSTGRLGFDPRQSQRIFPLTSVSRPALGPTQPPVQWVPGGPFPGYKTLLRRDADHSPPYSAKVKNK